MKAWQLIEKPENWSNNGYEYPIKICILQAISKAYEEISEPVKKTLQESWPSY